MSRFRMRFIPRGFLRGATRGLGGGGRAYRAVLLAVAVTAVALSGCNLLPGQAPATPTRTATPPDTPVPPSPTVAPPTPTAAEAMGQRCVNPGLELALTLPDDRWTCDMGDEFFVHLSSPVFQINMSSLGRGGPCGNIPDESRCTSTVFHTNEFITMEAWALDGQRVEIFGVSEYSPPGDTGRVWVSVNYEGMGERELTEAERQALIQLLDSIETGVTS